MGRGVASSPDRGNKVAFAVTLTVGAAFTFFVFWTQAAYGWTFQTTADNVLLFQRDVSDTSTQTLFVYTGATDPTAVQWRNGSFASTSSGGTFYNATGSNLQSVTVPPSCQLIAYKMQPGNSYLVSEQDGSHRFVNTRYKAAPVYMSVYNDYLPQGVTGTVVVSDMPSVSVASSISVAGTLPVDVESVGGVDPVGVQVLFALVALCGGLLIGKAVL